MAAVGLDEALGLQSLQVQLIEEALGVGLGRRIIVAQLHLGLAAKLLCRLLAGLLYQIQLVLQVGL